MATITNPIEIEPHDWKIEGANGVATARRGGREKVGCIIPGRGEDVRKVHSWLTTAARIPGFIGFAVGRTSFWEPLVSCREERITLEHAGTDIASRYHEFVNTFEGRA